MPYLNVRISTPPSQRVAKEVSESLLAHTSEILGKNPELTSISVDFVDPEFWFVGGQNIKQLDAVTFYLDIKITDGTNTKAQKANYIKAVFTDMEAILGPIKPASYIVIHDVGADSWGFQGNTQEYRFIQSYLG